MAGRASEDFVALDPTAVALLLDIDGTLIDIGPSPFEVHVPDDLRRSLKRLFARTNGALALVSGRPIRDIDTLFSPLKLPAIGGHGAEMRLREEITARATPLPQEMRQQLRLAVPPDAGVVTEDKGYSVALHYRKSPSQESNLHDAITQVCANFPREAVEVLRGKAMFEVKRPGISKGQAVSELMTYPPFADRQPIFIGDDVTDESVFAALPRLAGKGYSVGRPFRDVAAVFATPREVREALDNLAAKGRE